jgi:hypothetical protein
MRSTLENPSIRMKIPIVMALFVAITLLVTRVWATQTCNHKYAAAQTQSLCRACLSTGPAAINNGVPCSYSTAVFNFPIFCDCTPNANCTPATSGSTVYIVDFWSGGTCGGGTCNTTTSQTTYYITNGLANAASCP